LESGAGSTMLKFGLLFILVNVFLKLFIGVGIWKMAMEIKSNQGVKSSLKYDEEQIGEGDPNILRAHQGKMPSEQNNNSQDSEEREVEE
jgi:hypothetical protein